jgi:dihydroorotase
MAFLLGQHQKICQTSSNAQPTCGIKIFMGSMHGQLLVEEEAVLEPIFAKRRRLIAVHAKTKPGLISDGRNLRD